MKASGVQCRIYEAAMRLFARKGTDRVSVSDLAEEAGVARGTVYKSIDNPETLFSTVAGDLACEMQTRVHDSIADVVDPAQRLAIGIRLFIRRAHEEPQWGRFIVQFGFSDKSLRSLLTGALAEDLARAIESGRYAMRLELVTSMIAMIGGATLSGMMLVQEGYKSWREAGTDVAEMILIALGIDRKEASEIARAELPDLVN